MRDRRGGYQPPAETLCTSSHPVGAGLGPARGHGTDLAGDRKGRPYMPGRKVYINLTETEMEYRKIVAADMPELEKLQRGYKAEIGEDAPTEEDFGRLREAIRAGEILFFGCFEAGKLLGCCSVSPTFSTFNYAKGGVFEDFYILPARRGQGIARKLVDFARRESGVSSLTVGCADCDRDMYRSLGFTVPLGNLLAYGE